MCLLSLTSSLSLSEMNSGGRMTCLTKTCEFEYFTSSPQPAQSTQSINEANIHERDDEMHTTNN